MEFTIKTGSPDKLKTPCLVAGVFAGRELTPAAAALDKACGGALAKLLAGDDLDDKAGATLLLPQAAGLACERLLLVSLGKRDEYKDNTFRDALQAVAKLFAAASFDAAVCCLADEELPLRDLEWRLQQAAMTFENARYQYEATRSKKDKKKSGVTKLAFLTQYEAEPGMEVAAARGLAVAEGMALARELGNLPANICTPGHLADTATKLAKDFKLKVEILDRKEMEALGMGALLAVAQGAHEPPRFIVLQYKGAKGKQKPVVLVGKGITFDTGGISLKPSAEMDEMKYDMCGAAAVLGTVKAVARLGLPINLVALIPTTENMPGGGATRPGDVIKSMSGQTIEVLNTDAEGRLILCDALTYAERFKPACVIDVATLTGACVVALGKIPSGLLANDDALAAELVACGNESGDRVWQLPLWDDYQDMLKSSFADMANIGGRYAGTITAACFLSRYAKEYKWAHLDIAGTAWVSGEAKGATGRPVALLTQFLIGRAA